jgi:hypothetical protein
MKADFTHPKPFKFTPTSPGRRRPYESGANHAGTAYRPVQDTDVRGAEYDRGCTKAVLRWQNSAESPAKHEAVPSKHPAPVQKGARVELHG